MCLAPNRELSMKKNIIILLAVISFIGILANKRISGTKEVFQVDIASPLVGEIADSIFASGNLVFNTQVQLRTEVTGRVAKVLVEEGQTVAKGDLLMHLDTKAFEAEVVRIQAIVTASEIEIKRAEVSLSNIMRQLKSHREMVNAGLIDVETFDNMQNQYQLAEIDISLKRAQLEQSKASLSIAEDRLSKSVFISPMSGLLASVDIKEGETVIAGTTNVIGSNLMLIADTSAILAELRVDETDISGIKVGQTAKIFAAAYPDKEFLGTIIDIGTSAKEELGSNALSFKVKVLLEPTERSLYAGMSCRAEIATSVAGDVLKLPIEAFHQQGDKYFVWKVNTENQVIKQFVTVGVASDIEQALITGLELEDRVVVGPARPVSKIKDGDTVTQKFAKNDDKKESL